MGRSSVIHLKRPHTDLTQCGEDGPHYDKTYAREKVTCAKCKRRAGIRMRIPDPQAHTNGRMVQPGGGHSR